MNVPNFLTILRLIAAPGIALCFALLPRGMADWAAVILFVAASVTDFFDGFLARLYKQESRFGAMLDPIADKAIVVIALAVLLANFNLSTLVLIPVTVILFREVFVAGLREFLGSDAGRLKVTKLAKWKTTVQMVAITVLFSQGLFSHYYWVQSSAMETDMIAAIFAGEQADERGLVRLWQGSVWSYNIGLILLWISATLTAITGIDYYRKSRPYLLDGS